MLNACVLIKLEPTRADAILAAIRKIRGVRKAYFTYGGFDLVAFLDVEGYGSLREKTTQINAIDGVRSTETLVEA